MGKLYVSEFGELAIGRAQAMALPPLRTQIVDYSGTSAKTTQAFGENTRMIRVHTDSICSIAVGPQATITATTTDQRMAADQTEYYGVSPGQGIAGITNT